MKITGSCHISYLLLTVGITSSLCLSESTWTVVHASTPANGYTHATNELSSISSNKRRNVMSRNAIEAKPNQNSPKEGPEYSPSPQKIAAAPSKTTAGKASLKLTKTATQGKSSDRKNTESRSSQALPTAGISGQASMSAGSKNVQAMKAAKALIAGDLQNADMSKEADTTKSATAKNTEENSKAEAPSQAGSSEAVAKQPMKVDSTMQSTQKTEDSPSTDAPKKESDSATGSAANGNTDSPKAPASTDEPRESARDGGSVILKPGQRLNISGFAERKPAKVVDESTTSSAPQYHRVQMRLTGSMCIACLHEFQERILQVFGVERAKVEKSETPSLQIYSPDGSSYADGIVYIDTSRVDLIDLRAYMRVLGYHSYRVVDKAMEALPAPGQKKI